MTSLLKKNAALIIKKYITAVVTVTLIVIVSYFINFGEGLATNFIIGQCVGTFAFLFTSMALFFLRRGSAPVQMAGASFALMGGAAIGIGVGAFVAGKDLWNYLSERQELGIQVIILTLMVGSLFRYILDTQERIAHAGARIQKEKIKRLTIEKKMAETNLKLLQAQIEPHFLFNTLSNILSLLESDVEKGRHMIEDLIAYLRISLYKTREDMTTLGQEMDMVRAYLNIFMIRMGGRLRYRLSVDDAMRDIPFPPMLIQPLVENAIQHGLEPMIEGGEITVHAKVMEHTVRIEVADSGLGFREGSNWGVGLTNIRERLDALYDGQGMLQLEENVPGGLKVTIGVPHEAGKSGIGG